MPKKVTETMPNIAIIVEVSSKKKTLIAIVGPTAIGKTAMAISLAQHFNTEIISADSRQFYREMQIGTAVPSKEELSASKHHFIQHKSVLDSYSVGDFEKDALKRLDTLFKDKNSVVMVGGSGLYNNAVIYGLDKFPKIDSNVRSSLNDNFAVEGIEYLQAQLQRLDPDYFNKVDKMNPHRLIRALEVCIGSGKPYSHYLSAEKKTRFFDTLTIGITADRSLINERIDRRVDKMITDGLVDEVRGLIKHRGLNALRTVGYKELFQHFDGTWDINFAISEIKKNTRRFAKRQMTWFKKNQEIIWIPHDIDFENLVPWVEKKLV